MGQQNFVDVSTVKLREFSGTLTSGTSANITNNSSSETWLVKSLILANNDDQYSGDVEASVRFYVGLGFLPVYPAFKVWIPYRTNLTILNDSVSIYLDFDQYLTIYNDQGIKLSYTASVATIAE